MPAMLMQHANDPKAELVDAIGSTDDIEPFAAWILVAIYKRPERTKSGIFLADSTRDEDKYQGKVALVLKMGSLAFKDEPDKGIVFPNKVEPGDWIVLRVSDGWGCSVNNQDCRMVRDVDVKMKIARPDSVY